MIVDNNYVILPENGEEVRAANNAILNLRAERQHEELVLKHKANILSVINKSLAELSLCETKRIVRELSRKLHELDGTDE